MHQLMMKIHITISKMVIIMNPLMVAIIMARNTAVVVVIMVGIILIAIIVVVAITIRNVNCFPYLFTAILYNIDIKYIINNPS